MTKGVIRNMTYFVEGIQGSGKSTLVKLLSEKCPDRKVLEEGDYSPIELAWCAYMGMEDYQAALEKYPYLRAEIELKTHFEDEHAVVWDCRSFIACSTVIIFAYLDPHINSL